MIEAIGNVIAKHLIMDESESAMSQAVNLCSVLEDRVLDISSYCRARVLKTFYSLCEYFMKL
jgi:hypothetical protein